MDLKQFFLEDFREFSLDDTQRSLPSMIDGLKESQRKIIYGLYTKGINLNEIKVAQLAATVSECTDYHHGENSLESAIVGLANDYAGSNNINLLEPIGTFGSRLSPEASPARYIYTKFTPHFRELFRKEDDSILEHHYSDDMKIEPKYYLPLLPMVIVNGSIGIGTGYACKILSYNPKDIRSNILAVLNGRRMKSLLPWYKNFNGTIKRIEDSYMISGKLNVVNTTTIKITELPIGTYLDKYKAHLIKLENIGLIKDFEDNSTEEHFEFIIKAPRTTTSMDLEKLYSSFQLNTKVKENITVWNVDWKIRKYKNVNELIKEFVTFRVEKYEVRRLNNIKTMGEELKWLAEKLNFIKYYLVNSQSFTKKGKDALLQMLSKEGFTHIDKLLSLKIYSLTKDEIVKLKNNIKKISSDYKLMKNNTAKDMYIGELKDLKL